MSMDVSFHENRPYYKQSIANYIIPLISKAQSVPINLEISPPIESLADLSIKCKCL